MPLTSGLNDAEPINLTPMIDVVFNLLIFFLLSATYFTEERELELSVPSVQGSTPAVAGPEEIVINVNAVGRIRVDEKTYTLAELESFLVTARKNYPNQAIAIRGDKQTPYQWIAEVLSTCKRAEIRRIDVVVREGE